MKFFLLRAKESEVYSRFFKRFEKGFLALFILSLMGSFSAQAFADVTYEAGTRRNPFVPLVTEEGSLKNAAKVSTGEYKVEGIIFDPKEGSFALINGRFFKTGDQIDNAQLVSILKDRVVLSVNDSEKTVWLREERAEQR